MDGQVTNWPKGLGCVVPLFAMIPMQVFSLQDLTATVHAKLCDPLIHWLPQTCMQHMALQCF